MTTETTTPDATDEQALAMATITRAPDEIEVPYGRDGRGFRATWVLDRHDDGTPREVTTLTLFHYAGRGFAASVNRAKRTTGGGASTEQFAPFDATKLTLQIPATRFSAKRLREAGTVAVGHVIAEEHRDTYLHQFLLSSRKFRD